MSKRPPERLESPGELVNFRRKGGHGRTCVARKIPNFKCFWGGGGAQRRRPVQGGSAPPPPPPPPPASLRRFRRADRFLPIPGRRRSAAPPPPSPPRPR